MVSTTRRPHVQSLIRRNSWAAGFIKLSGNASDSMARCCFTKMCGSLVYMAPEVFTGGLYDEKCDVYSMAIVFCELLQRRPMAHELKLQTYAGAFKLAEKVGNHIIVHKPLKSGG